MTPHRGHTGPSGQRASLYHLLAAASVGYRRMNVSNFMSQTTEENPNMQQSDRSGVVYQIEDEVLLILIVRIGDRKEIYEIIRRL